MLLEAASARIVHKQSHTVRVGTGRMMHACLSRWTKEWHGEQALGRVTLPSEAPSERLGQRLTAVVAVVVTAWAVRHLGRRRNARRRREREETGAASC